MASSFALFPVKIDLVNSNMEFVASRKYPRLSETLQTLRDDGAVLLKHGRVGQPHFRHFRLSQDLSKLQWSQPNKDDYRSVDLSTVKEIRLGQSTAVFSRHPQPDVEHLSFSLIYGHGAESERESLDVVAKTPEEFDHWISALRFLTEYKKEGRTDQLKTEETQKPLPFALTRSPTLKRVLEGSDRSAETALGESVRSSAGSLPGLRDGRPSSSTRMRDSPQLQDEDRLLDAFSWGRNDRGQLGIRSRTSTVVPVVLEHLLQKNVRQVSCGSSHSLLLTREGEIYSWGCGEDGRLGHGDETDRISPTLVEYFAQLGLEGMSVAAGDRTSATISGARELYTWGYGGLGALGHGDFDTQWSPFAVSALTGVRTVSLGKRHTAAVTRDGGLYTWGDGELGQLGLGTRCLRTTSPTRVIVKVEGAFVSVPIAMDLLHSSSDKDIYQSKIAESTTQEQKLSDTDNEEIQTVWRKEDGLSRGSGVLELKDESLFMRKEKRTPVRFVSVACGGFHTVAIEENGAAYSFGEGLMGQLGHGTKESHFHPQEIAYFRGHGAKEEATNEGEAKPRIRIKSAACGILHSVFLSKDGRVFTCGKEFLGLGPKEASTKAFANAIPKVPKEVVLNAPVSQIAASEDQTLALTAEAQLYGWGYVGKGTASSAEESQSKVAEPVKRPLDSSPVLISFLEGKKVRSVDCGNHFAVAVCQTHFVQTGDLPHCALCRAEFSLTRRRRKCHNCGGSFCGNCTSRKLPLLHHRFETPVRVCDSCHKQLVQDSKSTKKKRERRTSVMVKRVPEENAKEGPLGRRSIGSAGSSKEGNGMSERWPAPAPGSRLRAVSAAVTMLQDLETSREKERERDEKGKTSSGRNSADVRAPSPQPPQPIDNTQLLKALEIEVKRLRVELEREMGRSQMLALEEIATITRINRKLAEAEAKKTEYENVARDLRSRVSNLEEDLRTALSLARKSEEDNRRESAIANEDSIATATEMVRVLTQENRRLRGEVERLSKWKDVESTALKAEIASLRNEGELHRQLSTYSSSASPVPMSVGLSSAPLARRYFSLSASKPKRRAHRRTYSTGAVSLVLDMTPPVSPAEAVLGTEVAEDGSPALRSRSIGSLPVALELIEDNENAALESTSGAANAVEDIGGLEKIKLDETHLNGQEKESPNKRTSGVSESGVAEAVSAESVEPRGEKVEAKIVTEAEAAESPAKNA